jgi:hypothetical protein
MLVCCASQNDIMAQVNTSTSMLNIKTVCWGMLGIIAIGTFEPAARAAIPATEPVVSITPRLLAAEPSLASILSGNSVPTSIKLRDLTPEWRAMSTNGQVEIGNFQALVGLFGGGAFANNYYTKGQTVNVGSETYIIAYSLISLPEKITPELSLTLSLLNLKTSGSMSNIRVFETVAETKVLEAQLASLQIANVFGGTKPGAEPKPAEQTPPVEPEVRPAEVQPQPTIRKKRFRSNRKYRRRQFRRNSRRTMPNVNRREERN